MQLTPREIEKLMVYTLADVALKRKNKGLKLNHPEAVAIITTTAMECPGRKNPGSGDE